MDVYVYDDAEGLCLCEMLFDVVLCAVASDSVMMLRCSWPGSCDPGVWKRHA